MLQLRIAVVGTTLAVGAWGAYTYQDRQKLPVEKKRHFTPGSADDIIQESLCTGDLVMFNRSCSEMLPVGAAVCALTKQNNNTSYDHVGMVIIKHGMPYILEATYTGNKLRPYDERIRCSRSNEILVRPLALQVGTNREALLRQFVENALQEPVSGATARFLAALAQCFGAARLANVQPSTELVVRAYQAMGLVPASFNASLLSPQDLAPGSRPLGKLTFNQYILIRSS